MSTFQHDDLLTTVLPSQREPLRLNLAGEGVDDGSFPSDATSADGEERLRDAVADTAADSEGHWDRWDDDRPGG